MAGDTKGGVAILATSFLLRMTVCQEGIVLSSEVFLCNQSAVLSCRFNNTNMSVQFQDINPRTNNFSPLTSDRIKMTSNYQEMKDLDLGEYNLTIMNVRMYNGSQYRCKGAIKDRPFVCSNIAVIQVDGDGDCPSPMSNDTGNATKSDDGKDVFNDTNNTTQSDDGTRQAGPSWVIPVVVPLAVLAMFYPDMHVQAVIFNVVILCRAWRKCSLCNQATDEEGTSNRQNPPPSSSKARKESCHSETTFGAETSV